MEEEEVREEDQTAEEERPKQVSNLEEKCGTVERMSPWKISSKEEPLTTP